MGITDEADTPVESIIGQVLEFRLGDEWYCVDVGNVTEIVDVREVTPMPNSPDHIEGVLDLRGRTTTIVDPKKLLELDVDSDDPRVMVFDPTVFEEEQSIGWLVDYISEVARVDEEDVEQSSMDEPFIRRILQRNGRFVIWLDPSAFHD